MTSKHPNADVEIVIVPGTTRKAHTLAAGRKIQRLVRDKLLLTSREPYRKAQVEIEYAPDGSPRALVVSMLRAYSYTADVARINVDAKYNATSVEPLGPSGVRQQERPTAPS